MSDIGRVRKTNEDSFLCDDSLQLWAVADGMGGHDAGEIASDLAVNGLHSNAKVLKEITEAALREAVTQTNLKIYNYGLQNDLPNGLGTTLTAVWKETETLMWVVHIGDSRLLRVRGDSIEQLTKDHSWVQNQIDLGLLSEEDALTHPLKNVIMRSLGYDAEIFPDILKIDWQEGDALFIASDGLTNKVQAPEILEEYKKSGFQIGTIRNLVDLALERGGEDNATLVLVAEA